MLNTILFTVPTLCLWCLWYIRVKYSIYSMSKVYPSKKQAIPDEDIFHTPINFLPFPYS